MDYLKELVEYIKPIFKEYGFKKKDLNWYFENDCIVKVFNIQKSQFSKKIYLNIGIIIKQIELDGCRTHIHFGLDHLINREMLDFENNIDNQERFKAFESLIRSNPYKFFTLKGKINEIKEFVKDTGTKAITLIARKFLEQCE